MTQHGPTHTTTEREPGRGGREHAALPVGGPPPGEIEGFLRALLEIQCGLAGAMGGIAYLVAGAGRPPGVAATYRGESLGREEERALADPGLVARLERLAGELCRDRIRPEPGESGPGGRVETHTLASSAGLYGVEGSLRLIATPLVAEGATRGACVLVSGAARGAIPPDELLTTLALTNARFEAYMWKERAFAEGAQKLTLRETLELLDAAQQGENAGAMGAIVAHELARRFGCTRVSIGLVRGEWVRLEAVSGADRIDRAGPAARQIEAVMEECADQDVEVAYPPPPGAEHDPGARRVTRAHAELSRAGGPGAVLSLPLRVEGDLAGVLVLERAIADPFPEGAVALLRLVAEYIGPALWTRRLADRGVLAVARDRAIDAGRALVGPRYTAWKLLGIAALVAFGVVSLWPIPARVKGEVEIRAATSRAIVPAFPGYISKVLVKPGDPVQEGTPLAELDARDLEKELARVEAQRQQALLQRDQSQSEGDQAKRLMHQAEADEADAILARIRGDLSRSVLRSPINGIVGRGNLEDLVGARVEPTQPLLEIVDAERIAVVLVKERDVHRVREAQTGTFAIRATPGLRVPVRVTRVNPMAEVVRGENVYMAECQITGDAASLLPGMSGTARIDEGRSTTMLSVLLRPMLDELRLRWWW